MQGRWKVREITTNEDDFVEHCVQGGYRIEVGNIFNFKDSITIFLNEFGKWLNSMREHVNYYLEFTPYLVDTYHNH